MSSWSAPRTRVTVSSRRASVPSCALILVSALLLLPSASFATPSQGKTQVAFVRFAPKAGRLRILTGALDGGPRRTLRVPISDVQGPSWSPDGRRIAFIGGNGVRESGVVANDVDLYVSRRDGRRVRRITRDALREAAPAWSPDGKTLVFVRYGSRGNRSTLRLVGADGSNPRQLTSGNVDLQPSWSPDGRRIVFVRISATYESRIWAVRPDGTGLRRILPEIAGATQPVWAPDGSRLLLTDGQALFTVRPDGSGRREVTRLTSDARGGRVDPQPDWSRSGWIVFCQLRPGALERSDVWRVRPDGSRLQRVTRSPGLDSEPSVRP